MAKGFQLNKLGKKMPPKPREKWLEGLARHRKG